MGFANYAVVGRYNSTSKCKWAEPNFEAHQVKCCICRTKDTRGRGEGGEGRERQSPPNTPPTNAIFAAKVFFYITLEWVKRRE